MNVDDVVFQIYQGIRRFGVVREKFFLDGWSHCKVEWVDDHKYNEAMEALSELRGGKDFRRYVYRIDELHRIDAEKELTTLCRCLELVNLK